MNRVAVFFPGLGYHHDKPLLYYSRDIAYEYGYRELVKVEYSYEKKGIKGDAEKMRLAFDEIYRQSEVQLSEIDFSKYDDILFVSKSIGTIVAAKYAKERGLSVANVLYTPLSETFDFQPQNAIAFTGTADAWVDYEIVKKRSADAVIPVSVYVGANHSLETDDTITNLKIMMDVMDRTRRHIIPGSEIQE
ncbi:MAG: alpha/beta hydrolase [Butyrivibrio sp.]|nr:alpha/beta hydrolase [Butyrivibrio sp.]